MGAKRGCVWGGGGAAAERKELQRGRAEGRYITDQGGEYCCGKGKSWRGENKLTGREKGQQ